MARKQEYGNESITSLKGADRVRKRPAVICGWGGVEGAAETMFGFGDKAVPNRFFKSCPTLATKPSTDTAIPST